ncbi:MAG: prolipoprotein diacylglyceryl transferase [Oscillospiraceae bacterium]|nr:prolipoprotein diacylglyceryl transferase [Oscillospiraceae bacterium]
MINNISFPGLGAEFEINRAAFYIGPKPVFWYGIIIAVGFFVSLLYILSVCEKKGVKPDTVYDVGICALVFGIIGARIYYVIFDFDSVRGSILNFFAVWNGGLAIYGGIIGGAVSVYIYCRRKGIEFLRVADLVMPGVMIGQAIGRWGNFFNAEVYGRATGVLWRMSINGSEGVHPLFLYESLWNTLGFALYLVFDKKYKKNIGEGICFYGIWYGTGRLFLEGMRQSQYILYIAEPVGISQVVSAAVICASAVLFYRLRKKAAK